MSLSIQSPPAEIPVPRSWILPLTDSKEEHLRQAVLEEALSWVGTPYYHQGDVKGAGVDCCMLLVKTWIEVGIVKPFDPRPYPSQWNLHKEEERYLNWLRLCAEEVEAPQVGDIVLWKFGKCYAHSAIYVGPNEVVHALSEHRVCTRTSMDEAFLRYWGRSMKLRPVKYFDVFAKIRSLYS